MKNISLPILLVLMVFATSSIQAQNSEPSKPTYEKRVYKNNGNTYVQKSLPLYLKFSTSPGGENHDLTSKKTPKYTNPMYLDTEGVNYIRSKWAVDPNTGKTVVPQQEVMYELYSDGLAPNTTIRLFGAPRYVRSGTIYYGKGLNFELTAKDAVSGVQKTQFSLNASSYSNYAGGKSVPNEGAYNLYFYSADNVGNVENTRSRTFTVDISSPKTTHAIDGIKYNNNIIAPSTKFQLSPSDNLSGVAATYYSFDDRGRQYGRTASVSYLSDGEHTIYYWSTDNVKNEESKGSFKFYLDKIPPVVTSSIVGDQYKGKYTYISSRTKINLTATDNKAGVENIYYRIDGGERVIFNSQFNIPNVKGVHSVKYDGMDRVKNLSGNKYLNVYMDNVPPTTGIDYKKPQFFHRDTLFINKNTDIVLFARDYESGVKKVEYSVDGGGFKTYAKFNLPNEGFHKINFKSTDNVNNVEQVKESQVFVDNTAPIIYANFSIESIGTKKKGGQSLKIYPNYTRLYLGATDAHVGTDQILYSINGGPLLDYSSPYTLDISEVNRFKKNKFHTIRVVAKDKLGNETEKTFEFYVGRASDN